MCHQPRVKVWRAAAQPRRVQAKALQSPIKLALGTAGLLCLATVAGAHDFWLVPVGDEIEARTGSRFPVSTNAIAADRMIVANAVSAGGRIPLTVMGRRDSALVLRADLRSTGTFYAVVTLAQRDITLGAREFNAYLKQDGLPQILAERRARGELDRPARERYQKFAKLLLHKPGTGSVATLAMDQRLEIVPLVDPFTLRRGDRLPVQVRFDGRGISGLTLGAGQARVPQTRAFRAMTDSAGNVTVPLPRAGLWSLRIIHMRRAQQPGADWESYWATLTFNLP
jgi:uncharacterized GH25 family protein